MSETKAEIIVPKSGLDYALTYLVPEVFLNLLQIGSPVIVPLKSRKTYGFVSSINSAYPSKSANLKKIISISKNSFFNQNHLNFYNWLASYYHESIARVLDTALPSIDAKNFHLLDVYAEYNNQNKNNKNLDKSNININAPRGNSNNKNNSNSTDVPVVSSIISSSISSPVPYSAISITDTATDTADYLKLTEDQLKAIETIKEPIKENFYKTFLLHGVTASGKTEIYLNLLEYTLSLNKQVIIIVPEIYITNQFIDIMKKRFSKMLNPHEFAIFHSKIAKKEKLINWFKILSGEIKIVLGARSAIFAPLIKPGLIIVDEEHDSSYKQESEFLYNARDIAVMLAKKSNSVAVLGSATPSLESFYNAKTIKKYEYINIKERVSGRYLPEIKIIDLKNEFKSNNLNNNKNINFSDEMLSEISRNETIENVNQKRQVLLFLNRRGFSTFIICKSCGHQFICKNCAVSMVYHKGKNYEKSFLKCHYCNYTEEVPKLCPECLSDNIEPYGIGIQKLEDKVNELFGDSAKIARIDSDIGRNKKIGSDIFNKMNNGMIDILIGTQIVAKGHDFPNVGLVVVISADSLLNIPDFRSAEKTFQMLMQVSGRAGRGDMPGNVIFQTFNSTNYVIQYASKHDIEGFFEKELSLRKEYSYPPYAKIITLRLTDKDFDKLQERAFFLKKIISESIKENTEFKKISVLGPSPCPISKLNNNFRFQIIIKSPLIPGEKNISYMHNFIDIIKSKSELNKFFISRKIVIDVDPDVLM